MAPTDASGRDPWGQNRLERAIERVVTLFAQAMVLLGLGAGVYGFLIAMFFFCCGAGDTFIYLDPAKSPLGPTVTIALVWPAVGLLCSMLQGSPREILDAIGEGIRHLVRKVRPS